MPPVVIFFLGRPGSGKGTQIKQFIKDTGFDVVKTGELLRERAKKEDFIGKKISETLLKGGLIPTPIVFLLWIPLLLNLYEKKTKGVVFDGNPRKLYEAYMLEEVFEMFGWERFVAVHLKISEKEVFKRLKNRKREDDKEEEVKERLRWFKRDVLPVISYFQKKGKLVEINGEQSVEEIRKKLNSKIKRFIKS